jgi:hypothetical protein
MTNPITISASSEQDVMLLLEHSLSEPDPAYYHAILRNDYQEVELFIDKDPGSGYDRPSSYMSLTSILDLPTDFTFSIRRRTVFDRLISLVYKRGVKTGMRVLDTRFVVKTSDRDKLIGFITDSNVIAALNSLPDFTFAINVNESVTNKHLTLELKVHDYSKDMLAEAYGMFNVVLGSLKRGAVLRKVVGLIVGIAMAWFSAPNYI